MPRQSAETVTPALLRGWPLPSGDGGKEGRGQILVVGGSRETPGAVLLAAEAALRCGAGKLQIATACSVATAVATAVPESMVRGLEENESGAIRRRGIGPVKDLATSADCVLVGPGLVDAGESGALARAVIDDLDVPIVLDALALAAVTEDPGCLRPLAGRVVLTPNPAELAQSVHLAESAVEEAPDAACAQLAELTGAVVTVGGHTSWTVDPDGRSWRDDGGAPGLGVSGAGDVRAGLVAGLLARGAEPAQAALWGAHLHGRAGERLSARLGPLGYLAREIVAEVPALLVEINH